MSREYGRRHGEGWAVHRETRTEAGLARALRARGLRFEREVPIEEFTVDFLVDGRLVVEVDGVSHNVQGRPQVDQRRDRRLRSLGFEVLRVPARDIAADDTKRWVECIVASLRPRGDQRLASETWKNALPGIKTGLEAEEKRRAARQRGEKRAQAPVQLGSPRAEEELTMEELFKEPTTEDFATLLAQSPDPPDKDQDRDRTKPRRWR
ncbi:MAG: DUF559 domain-containing protein [Bacillota bacterium]